jgi:uncharacterized protein YjdB
MWCRRFGRAFLSFAAFLFVTTCGKSAVDPGRGETTLTIRADVTGTSIATVVVDVTASDIPTALVFNIPVVGHVVSGTITVPAGSDRTFTLRAYDAGGVETHSGAVTLDIQPGTNPTIAIVLTPLTGELPINATLGSITVTVTPSPDSLAVGDTLRLTAAITDAKGHPQTGPVGWASDDPGVAVVDASGLVTAMGRGNTTVVATFQGAAGSAAVKVTP